MEWASGRCPGCRLRQKKHLTLGLLTAAYLAAAFLLLSCFTVLAFSGSRKHRCQRTRCFGNHSFVEQQWSLPLPLGVCVEAGGGGGRGRGGGGMRELTPIFCCWFQHFWPSGYRLQWQKRGESPTATPALSSSKLCCQSWELLWFLEHLACATWDWLLRKDSPGHIFSCCASDYMHLKYEL